MSFDEIIERTTIDFPLPIDREETENLLRYISDNLPGNVRGRVDYFINYNYDPKSGSSLKDVGTLKLGMMVINHKEPMAFDNFVSKPFRGDTSKIIGIEFNRVPDWDILDYRKEVQELWEDTRKVINEFFKEHYDVKTAIGMGRSGAREITKLTD